MPFSHIARLTKYGVIFVIKKVEMVCSVDLGSKTYLLKCKGKVWLTKKADYMKPTKQ